MVIQLPRVGVFKLTGEYNMEDLAMYCTPAEANVQIEQFIKAQGRVKADKYEVVLF